MRVPRALVSVFVVAGLCGGSLAMGGLTSAVRASGPPAWHDFDKDGFADLAIGVPFDIVDGVRAGAVHVLYGGPDGLGSARSQLWNANNAGGIGPPAKLQDRFGEALASGDFDGDGFGDLAIGAPGEDVSFGPPGPISNAGMIHVLYGSEDGLTTDGADRLTAGIISAGDEFGSALAAGEFSGASFGDLAVGQPGANRVWPLFGSAGGLQGPVSGQQILCPDAVAGDRCGAAVATGQLDDDILDEIVMGAPNADITVDADVRVDAGRVIFFKGGTTGDLSHYVSVSEDDVAGDDAQAGAHFGTSIAIGVQDADALNGVLVGAPEHDVQGTAGLLADAGLVVGIVTHHDGPVLASKFTIAHEGLTVQPKAGDRFGAAIAVGNIGGGPDFDAVVAAPGRKINGFEAAGAVAIYYDTAAPMLLHQDTDGVLGSAAAQDGFGRSLAIANYGHTARGDLAVGVPHDRVGSLPGGPGAVQVFYGVSSGLNLSNDQRWTQDSAGVDGTAAQKDGFGVAVH